MRADGFISVSLAVVLNPLAESVGIFGGPDGGKGPAWVADTFPRMLQSLLPAVHSEDVYNAHKVAVVWPVHHVDCVLAVGQQPAVVLKEFLQLGVVCLLEGRL